MPAAARASTSPSVGLSPGCRAVGVELSPGGIRATAAAHRPRCRAPASCRATSSSLPFPPNAFDGAYWYGVVHHTVDPEGAVREIVAHAEAGRQLLIYVYEDVRSRGRGRGESRSRRERGSPADQRDVAGGIRRVCAMLAPFVYVTCTIPSRHFSWAKRFPYPATQNPT